MRFIDEFRSPELVQKLVDQIRRAAERPVRIMEFCGGHTHAIFRFGLRQMLAPLVEMRAGPGCPVCVTASADLDRAIAMADLPRVILTTYGDMLRVPGQNGTLQDARARGADVRMVYSPTDAVDIARKNPDREVIFLGVGFETTAPGAAASLLQAEREGVDNFSLLSLHKLTPPAMRALLNAGEVHVDGILGPGHVTAVTGTRAWEFLPAEYSIPCAVSGFEPVDLLGAISALVEDAMSGRPRVVNAYARGVTREGNLVAQRLLDRVFEPVAAEWRGFGVIPASGLRLRSAYAHRDAERLHPIAIPSHTDKTGCRCGEVLRGLIEPHQCGLYRRVCTPANPVGPCMVSAEGACAAYIRYEEVV